MAFIGDTRDQTLKKNRPWRAAADRLGVQLRRWAQNRQGTDPHTLQLHSRRIYILPTAAGVVFAIIVFTMLIGSMNYNNNLGFTLTFLLVSIAIISIHHCHRNLAGVRLQFQGVKPVFSGEKLLFRFMLENGSACARWQLHFAWDGYSGFCIDLDRNGHASVEIPLQTSRRGILIAPRLQLSTRFPFGLLRAWAWINMDLQGLVYPTPARRATIRFTGEGKDQQGGFLAEGVDDFHGLRDYRRGDPPRRIAWKALAHSGELMVKEYRSGTAPQQWLDWDLLAPADTETRLSLLARLILDAKAAQTAFGLRLPGKTIPPVAGDSQVHRCLRALARHEDRKIAAESP